MNNNGNEATEVQVTDALNIDSNVPIDSSIAVDVVQEKAQDEPRLGGLEQQKEEKVTVPLKNVVDPFLGDTAARFEVPMIDICEGQTTEIHGMELLEQKYGKEPDSEEFSAHYVSIHNYWKSLESKCVPKYNSTLKRDRIEDLAGRYASFGVNSLSSNAGSDDTLTTEDMKFIDDSQFYDIYIPATMETPHGGFYVNDESLQFEMLDGEKDEQNDDKEIDDLSQDELEEKRKKKRRRKEIGDIVIAKKQKAEDSGSGEKIYLDWTDIDFKLLKSSVRKFKTNWQLIKLLAFPDKSPEEIKKAWAHYHKMKKKEDNSTNSSVVTSTSDKITSQESALGPVLSSVESKDDQSIASSNLTFVHPPTSQQPSKTRELHLHRDDSDCELLNAEENLPLSLIKKKSISAGQSNSNTGVAKSRADPFEREDVPLAKLKADTIQSFENCLKELPPNTRRKIKIMLTQYKKCDGNKELENQMFLRQIPKLLPHINALHYSRKFPNISNIEEHILSQFTSSESKEVFKSILTSTRRAMGAQLGLFLRKFTEVVKSEINVQQKHYDARVKMLMEKRPNFKDSVNHDENPVMPQKKFTYSKGFKEALKNLLEQYLNTFYAESISGSRDAVLKKYISRKLMPLWGNTKRAQNETSNNSESNNPHVANKNSTADEKTTKATKWVTVESLLTISRQVLTPAVPANKPVKTLKPNPSPNEENSNKRGSIVEANEKERASVVSHQPCTSKQVVSVANYKPNTQNTVSTVVASSQHSGNKSNAAGVSQRNKDEVLDSSNEDLDTPLASLLSVDRSSNAAIPKSANNSEVKCHPVPPAHVDYNLENFSKAKSPTRANAAFEATSNNAQTIEQIVKKVSFGMSVPNENFQKTSATLVKTVPGSMSWQNQPEMSQNSAVNTSAIQETNPSFKYRGSIYGRSMGSIAARSEGTNLKPNLRAANLPLLNAHLNSQVSPPINQDVSAACMTQNGHFKVSPPTLYHQTPAQPPKSPSSDGRFSHSVHQDVPTSYETSQAIETELQLKQLQLKLLQHERLQRHQQAKPNETPNRVVFSIDSPPDSIPAVTPSIFSSHSVPQSQISPTASLTRQTQQQQQATPPKRFNAIANCTVNTSLPTLPSFANTFPKHHSPTSASRSSNVAKDQRLHQSPSQSARTPVQPSASPTTPQSEQAGAERKLRFTSFLNPARLNSSPLKQNSLAPQPSQSKSMFRSEDQISPMSSSALLQHFSPEHLDYVQHYMNQLKQREQQVMSSPNMQYRPTLFSVESPEKR